MSDVLVIVRALGAIVFTVLWVIGMIIGGAVWIAIGGPIWSRG